MKPERWQQVERLYYAALEREPDEHAAFLESACAGDESLRREVASLVAAGDRVGAFMEPPVGFAAEAPTTAPQPSMIGQTLTHYRIVSLLGKGGMGEVYLGEDTTLGRKVALKLLPAVFTSDRERLRRFEQEARTVSALNHPNIITIHEIGQVHTEAGGMRYLVTEYIEGETLRQRAEREPLILSRALDIAVQVASALAAAHAAGITHRDIKPENVMVRPDGYIKVLDFGLAKLTERLSDGGTERQSDRASVESSSPRFSVSPSLRPSVPPSMTEAGLVMGTPRYMSPEQARGEKVDARTDIFSLGVMLYEMIAGCPPFAGATTNDLIAALLKDEPAPLTSHAPATPPELARIVGQALRKNREERYQNAGDLLTDLKQLSRDREFAAMRYGEREQPDASNSSALRESQVAHAPRTAPAYRRLTAIAALAGFVIAATAAWFYFNRSPILTSQDTILLADFENRTGDAIFDGTLKQGLAIQLQQSPFLKLFPEARVRQTLLEMNRPPNAQVTAEVAREICERHNLKALIAGSIAPLGSHYVITLEAINGQSGESLARHQVEAESKEQVLRALSQAATQLREKLGESLSSIQRFDKPLEQATTSKLEAFKAWSVGVEHSYRGQAMEAIPFYKRAVELDPDFTHAYSLLSVVHWATGRPGLAAEYAEKGYALRDRVSEYEKLRITSFYHGYATGDLDKQIEVLMLLKRMYPRDSGAPIDLALTYNMIGQYDQAVAEAREAIRLNPNFAPAHKFLGWPLLRLNRFAEAKDVIAQALQQKLDTPDFHAILYQIAFTDGATAGMQQQIDWTRGRPDEYIAFDWQTGAAAFAGQWRKAQDFSRRAIDLAARGDTKEVAARYATEQALRGAVFGDCRRARADAAQGLKLARGRASLPRAALALSLCGEMSQAKPLADELTKRYPGDTVVNSIWLPAIRATMNLQRGDAAQAIEQLQAASRYEAAAEFWPQYLRGLAYLKLGRGAEAGTEFQKILSARGQAPLSVLYLLAHLGLAHAADPDKRNRAYQDFFTLWKDADPDLPILRTTKQEYDRLVP